MLHLWRISNHSSLSGEGGLRYSARWHTAGSRIVYLAESPAGALIEVLVHLELEESELPSFYKLIRVAVPVNIAIETLHVPDGDDWKQSSAVTRSLGNRWLQAKRSVLARVPSAIVPDTWNYLFNPEHPHADQIRIEEIKQAEFDPRLLRKMRE